MVDNLNCSLGGNFELREYDERLDYAIYDGTLLGVELIFTENDFEENIGGVIMKSFRYDLNFVVRSSGTLTNLVRELIISTIWVLYLYYGIVGVWTLGYECLLGRYEERIYPPSERMSLYDEVKDTFIRFPEPHDGPFYL